CGGAGVCAASETTHQTSVAVTIVGKRIGLSSGPSSGPTRRDEPGGLERHVSTARAHLHAVPADLDADRPILAVECLVRRTVAEHVIRARVALDRIERAAEVVLVADRDPAGVDREAVRAVGL